MTENNQKQMPKFDSLDELTDFFDENDMGDYLENMPEVDFAVNIKNKLISSQLTKNSLRNFPKLPSVNICHRTQSSTLGFGKRF